jgi:prepilin peptidase CpaA
VNTVDYIQFALVIGFTLVAAVCDFRTKRLPNWLTVPCFLAALIFHGVRGGMADGAAGVGSALLTAMAGFGVGFGILFVLWITGGGGAGDVKLMGALGAWFGPVNTFILFVVSTGFVIALSIGVLGWQMLQRGAYDVKRKYLSKEQTERKTRGLTSTEADVARKQKRRLMPYGVPVALAAWVVLVWSFRSQLFGL